MIVSVLLSYCGYCWLVSHTHSPFLETSTTSEVMSEQYQQMYLTINHTNQLIDNLSLKYELSQPITNSQATMATSTFPFDPLFISHGQHKPKSELAADLDKNVLNKRPMNKRSHK
ncbi:MAG: hypothetical protein DWP95_13325 [Proteobacteria bacterium]|nr:MAG: hypothetical protein DWP95_13325 [Pseudomonadota bacterium]